MITTSIITFVSWLPDDKCFVLQDVHQLQIAENDVPQVLPSKSRPKLGFWVATRLFIGFFEWPLRRIIKISEAGENVPRSARCGRSNYAVDWRSKTLAKLLLFPLTFSRSGWFWNMAETPVVHLLSTRSVTLFALQLFAYFNQIKGEFQTLWQPSISKKYRNYLDQQVRNETWVWSLASVRVCRVCTICRVAWTPKYKTKGRPKQVSYANGCQCEMGSVAVISSRLSSVADAACLVPTRVNSWTCHFDSMLSRSYFADERGSFNWHHEGCVRAVFWLAAPARC